VFIKRNIFYVLFSLAYIGFLILEKPWFSVEGRWLSYLPTFLVHFSLMLFVVLINNKFLIPNFFENKKFALYVFGVCILITVFTFTTSWYNLYINSILFHEQIKKSNINYHGSLVYGNWIIIVACMLYITQKWFDQRDLVKNIEISQLQTELKYLRSQINPHFLFNGLNTIYSCIDMKNDHARDIVVQFSDLLRYNLYEADVDRIGLEKEMNFLKNYVALQKARTNENVTVTLDAKYQNGNLQIAPLIFLSFVENAFKYVSGWDEKCNYIHIVLHETEGRIHFDCRNTYDQVDTGQLGIGLNNVARRLELLYKGQYELNIAKKDGIYQSSLMMSI